MKSNKQPRIYILFRFGGFFVHFVLFYIFGIVNPALSQAFVDRVLSGGQPGWLNTFFILVTCVALLQVGVTAVQAYYGYKIRGELDLHGSTIVLLLQKDQATLLPEYQDAFTREVPVRIGAPIAK